MKLLYSVLIIALTLMLCGSAGAWTMDTGFEIEDLDVSQQQSFLDNVQLTLLTAEPEKAAIVCFDVNEAGLAALGSDHGTTATASVYDANGVFLYGYAFGCGQSFGIEWDGDNLIIYFVKSDVAASFDSNGKNVGVAEIMNTIENNSYWNKTVFATRRTVGRVQYRITNDLGILNLFLPSYSQLVKIDSSGDTTVLYDVGFAYAAKAITCIVGVVLLFTIVLLVVFSQYRNCPKQGGSTLS